jgi:hypothetical protein
MADESLPFKIVRTNGSDEVIARVADLLVAAPRLSERRRCIRGMLLS